MKICKKATALLLCVITLFGFTSCADDNFFEILGVNLPEGDSIYMKTDWNEELSEPVFVDFDVYRKKYETLNNEQQRAYNFIYNSIFSHPAKIFLRGITPEEMLEIFEALKYDNPHLLCLADEFRYYEFGNVLCVMPDYTHSQNECLHLSERLISEAKEICSVLENESDDFIKEIFVNDTIAKMCVYGESENSSDASGVFFDNTAVCSGYALAAKLLLDIISIESFTVSGTVKRDGETQGHMWLAVKINGEWYHFDPTWNDVESEDMADAYGYRFFNLTSEELSKTHSDFILPEGIECNSEEEEYYIRSGLYCTKEDWRDIVEHTVQSIVFELPACAAFEFESKELFEEVSDSLFVSSPFLANVLESVYRYTGKRANEYSVSYFSDETRNILEIYFE